MTILDTARELLADAEAAQDNAVCPLFRDEVAALCRALIARTEALRELAQKAIAYDNAIRACANSPDTMASYCTAEGDDLDALYMAWQQAAVRALSEPEQQSNTGEPC